MATTNRLAGTRPKQEGGQYRIKPKNWKFYMNYSRKVMKILPKFDLPGQFKNPILTRIDVGTGLKNVPKSFFVNEVEFVPSLYLDKIDFPIVEEIAESLLGVAFQYHFLKGEPNVKF